MLVRKNYLYVLFSLISLSLVSKVAGATTSPSNVFQTTPFFAISVKDLEQSVSWYQRVFHMKVKKKIDDPNGIAKVRILEGASFNVELLQHSQGRSLSSVTDQIKMRPLLHGIFKIGFSVPNVSEFYQELKEEDGITFRTGLIKDDEHQFFIIKDNEGNSIHIMGNP